MELRSIYFFAVAFKIMKIENIRTVSAYTTDEASIALVAVSRRQVSNTLRTSLFTLRCWSECYRKSTPMIRFGAYYVHISGRSFFYSTRTLFLNLRPIRPWGVGFVQVPSLRKDLVNSLSSVFVGRGGGRCPFQGHVGCWGISLIDIALVHFLIYF